MKIKRLTPSLREKKRYLVYEVISEKPITNPEPEITKVLYVFLGELGMAKAGIIHFPDKYNQKTQRGFMKVNHKHVDEVKVALSLIKDINNNKVIVKSVKVSGMINKAEEYLRGA